MRIRPFHTTFGAVLAVAAFAAFAACQPTPAPGAGDPIPAGTTGLAADAHIVEVIAEDYAFQAPDAIPSGWTTFRMRNEGEETHFIFLTRLAGDRTYDEYILDVGRPIAEVLRSQRAGELDKAQAGERLGAAIPAWYWSDAVSLGGPGLVAPGGVSQATVRLEPGTYVMECYMKTPDGELHWMEGMIRPLTVTSTPSGASAPAADVHMTLTTDGFSTDGPLRAGLRTVAVRFAEQPEVGFGNDVHVVRLEDGMTAAELIPWMDFLNVHGLQNPAPAEFLGGVQERPAGHTAYFTVDLAPGRYAWISESADVHEMAQEFDVRP